MSRKLFHYSFGNCATVTMRLDSNGNIEFLNSTGQEKIIWFEKGSWNCRIMDGSIFRSCDLDEITDLIYREPLATLQTKPSPCESR